MLPEEAVGFEPTVPCYRYTTFPMLLFRPTHTHFQSIFERGTGLEPATISLENWDSAIELPPQD